MMGAVAGAPCAVLALGMVAVLGMLDAAHAESVPRRGSVDPRVRVVVYNPDDVVRLRGYTGYQITLQFAEGEEFVRLGAGDSGMMDVGKERNFVFLKPKVQHSATNITLLTTQRHYHFDYAAVNKVPNPKKDDVIYAIRFVYPQEEAMRAAAEADRARVDGQLRRSAEERGRNFDYWFCGSDSLKPVSAYDDGVQTRLRFGARSEMPAIFLKNEDETESLVNFNLEGGEVVIHRVAPQFVLRRGNLVGCVVNKSFEGGGTRLDTGTVSPQVRRELRGGS